ncbi:MAG: efflux RND transporter periplasmic adaptor subunit [Kiritimatiellia bacterium]
MSRSMRILIWTLRIVLPLAVIGGAAVLYNHIISSSPEQLRQPPQERRVYVQTRKIKRQDKSVSVRATGKVVPVEKVSLTVRVTGEVVQLNQFFEPGEIIKKGDPIVNIDKADYLLAVKQAESALIEAEYKYKVEQGYQEVARHEWDLLENRESVSPLEKELTLRRPHLQKAKAEVESAETELEQAKLNLTRTSISLPFDALVVNRDISVGSQVTSQVELGVLVDASLFRVEVTLPVDRLEWIDFPSDEKTGSEVTIYAPGNLSEQVSWKGVVSRLIPRIEDQGRLAQVLIDVRDPMKGDMPLLLNSFVSVSIASRELKGVFVIPSKAVHNGDIVYTVNSDSRISFRKIKILWRGREWVLTRSGVEDGQILVTTEVPSVVPGMQVIKVRETGDERRGENE